MPRVTDVTPAAPQDPTPGPSPTPAPPAEGPASRGQALRAWLGASPSPHSPPFSRHRWVRLLTYLVTVYIALALALGGGSEITDTYRLAAPTAFLLASLQAAAVVLALWRPVPAWVLSLADAVATALLARSHLESVPGQGPEWPWATPALQAHMAVFLLLALRVRVRGTLGALAATALLTWVLQTCLNTGHSSGTGFVAVLLFAVAVLVGTVLRSRSEVRTQLVQQTTITAEERARRTLLEERSRIARELHDVVAHHMSVISIQAQVAPHLVENPSEELKENLAGIRNNALEALTELRRVLGVLRSEQPDDPSAPDAPQPNLARLDALLENTRAAGLHVEKLVVGEERSYPPGVELSAYRIIQEALSNVLRHAPGAGARVEIDHLPDGIFLSIINGRPRYRVLPSPGSGHGLLGIRERAAMLGGHVTTTSTVQGGFMVTAFLPRAGTPVAGHPPTGDGTP
ncbi:sensor histidine kinase [Streptomyces sp. NPDC127190]|uniref:sensor histidine kinase n=1 Tax=unclassified Streptomyces TaxID=2593676 RepID=UPI003628E3C2